MASAILPALAAAPVAGLWYTSGHEGGIEIYECGEQLCGRIHWLNSGAPAHDVNNPEESQRQRLLCGTDILTGFRFQNESLYTDGKIYDPKSGSTYQAQIKLISTDQLELRGYIGSPVFGLSQTWTRAAAMPSCIPAAAPAIPTP